MHYAAPVDQTAGTLTLALGARVRQGRLARGWTLDRLAEVAGVSRRMLVTLEQGASNPSLGTLLRISDALGIGLPALVELPPQPSSVKVTRAGGGPLLWSSSAGGRAVLLAGTAPPNVVELWDWTLGPHDRHVSEAHAVGTEELLVVERGRVLVEVAGDVVTLDVGDSVTFSGDVVHGYANPDPRPARFVLTVLEPGVGSDTRSKVPDA